MRFLKATLPVAIFAGVLMLLWQGLGLNPKNIDSPLIDKPLPKFSLPDLMQPQNILTNQDLTGEVALVNVWASWCPACSFEHGTLMKIAATNEVPIYGVNYKDIDQKAIELLDKKGNPYIANIKDSEGLFAIDLGIYGTPETYIIDQNGKIRYKHVGIVTWGEWKNKLLPKINELKQQG